MLRYFTLTLCTLIAAPSAYAASAAEGLRTAVKVRTVMVARDVLSAPVEVVGTVEPFRKATIAADARGEVVARLVEPGMKVDAGEVLLRIDPAPTHQSLRQAKAELRLRQVDLAHARHEHRRGQRLIKTAVISQDTLDDLRFAEERARAGVLAAEALVAERERQHAETEIKSPFDGIVHTVLVQVGDYVNHGVPIAQMADFSKVRVVGGVTATEAQRIDLEEPAQVAFNALAGRAVQGQIAQIGRVTQGESGTYPVEIWLDGSSTEGLREGMLGTIRILDGDAAPTLVIPSQAIFRRDGTSKVYVVANDRAQERDVTLGRRTSARVEVLNGLSAGERVVVEGQFALRSGANVTELDQP